MPHFITANLYNSAGSQDTTKGFLLHFWNLPKNMKLAKVQYLSEQGRVYNTQSGEEQDFYVEISTFCQSID